MLFLLYKGKWMWCIHSTTPISKNKCSRFHSANVGKWVGDKVVAIQYKLPYNLSRDLYNPTKTIILLRMFLWGLTTFCYQYGGKCIGKVDGWMLMGCINHNGDYTLKSKILVQWDFCIQKYSNPRIIGLGYWKHNSLSVKTKVDTKINIYKSNKM